MAKKSGSHPPAPGFDKLLKAFNDLLVAAEAVQTPGERHYTRTRKLLEGADFAAPLKAFLAKGPVHGLDGREVGEAAVAACLYRENEQAWTSMALSVLSGSQRKLVIDALVGYRTNAIGPVAQAIVEELVAALEELDGNRGVNSSLLRLIPWLLPHRDEAVKILLDLATLHDQGSPTRRAVAFILMDPAFAPEDDTLGTYSARFYVNGFDRRSLGDQRNEHLGRGFSLVFLDESGPIATARGANVAGGSSRSSSDFTFVTGGVNGRTSSRTAPRKAQPLTETPPRTPIDSDEAGESRPAYLPRILADLSPNAMYLELKEIIAEQSHAFRRGVAGRIERPFNDHIAAMSQSTLAEKRALASWINEELNQLGLAIGCKVEREVDGAKSESVLPSTIIVHTDVRNKDGCFRLQFKDHDGSRKRLLFEKAVPYLGLIEAHVRLEGFRTGARPGGAVEAPDRAR